MERTDLSELRIIIFKQIFKILKKHIQNDIKYMKPIFVFFPNPLFFTQYGWCLAYYSKSKSCGPTTTTDTDTSLYVLLDILSSCSSAIIPVTNSQL